jgi:peroxiredoxin
LTYFPIRFQYEDYQQHRFTAEWEYDKQTNKLYPSLQAPVSAYAGLWEYDAEADKAYPRDSLKAPAFWVPVQPNCCESGSAPRAEKGEAAREQGKDVNVKAALTDDVAKNVAVLRGKIVILCFWAVRRCGPCQLQMAELVSLQTKYRNQGVEIVGVSIDMLIGHPDDAAVAAFVKDNGINYSILVANNVAALAGYDVNMGIPATFLLDRAGRTVKSYVGWKPLLAFEEDLKKLLP